MLSLVTQLFLIACTTLAVLHVVLIELLLYWRFPWIDVAMHVFGGSTIALGFFALGDLGVRFVRHRRTWMWTLGAVLFAALFWEIYEYVIRAELLRENYTFDTTVDLIAGMLGGVLGFLLARHLTNSYG